MNEKSENTIEISEDEIMVIIPVKKDPFILLTSVAILAAFCWLVGILAEFDSRVFNPVCCAPMGVLLGFLFARGLIRQFLSKPIKRNYLIKCQIIKWFLFYRQRLSRTQITPDIWMLGKNNFELHRLCFVPAAQPVTIEYIHSNGTYHSQRQVCF
jgi:hypothetical protein